MSVICIDDDEEVPPQNCSTNNNVGNNNNLKPVVSFVKLDKFLFKKVKFNRVPDAKKVNGRSPAAKKCENKQMCEVIDLEEEDSKVNEENTEKPSDTHHQNNNGVIVIDLDEESADISIQSCCIPNQECQQNKTDNVDKIRLKSNVHKRVSMEGETIDEINRIYNKIRHRKRKKKTEEDSNEDRSKREDNLKEEKVKNKDILADDCKFQKEDNELKMDLPEDNKIKTSNEKVDKSRLKIKLSKNADDFNLRKGEDGIEKKEDLLEPLFEVQERSLRKCVTKDVITLERCRRYYPHATLTNTCETCGATFPQSQLFVWHMAECRGRNLTSTKRLTRNSYSTHLSSK